MGEFLRAEIAAGRRYLPAGANVLRAFTQPFDDVRVLIVGRIRIRPRGTRSACRSRWPRTSARSRGSLANIFREYTERPRPPGAVRTAT